MSHHCPNNGGTNPNAEQAFSLKRRSETACGSGDDGKRYHVMDNTDQKPPGGGTFDFQFQNPFHTFSPISHQHIGMGYGGFAVNGNVQGGGYHPHQHHQQAMAVLPHHMLPIAIWGEAQHSSHPMHYPALTTPPTTVSPESTSSDATVAFYDVTQNSTATSGGSCMPGEACPSRDAHVTTELDHEDEEEEEEDSEDEDEDEEESEESDSDDESHVTGHDVRVGLPPRTLGAILMPVFPLPRAPVNRAAMYSGVPPNTDMDATFTTVPGRCPLLSASTKYKVSVGEVLRRINPPECLHASLVNGVLRKAKARDGAKELRAALAHHGIELPVGRRKLAPTSAFTAFVEEEALIMAKDFSNLCKRELNTSAIAMHMVQRNMELTGRRQQLVAVREFLDEMSSIINTNPVHPKEYYPDSSKPMASVINNFGLITHGFGPPALLGVVSAFREIAVEALRMLGATGYEKLTDFPMTMPMMRPGVPTMSTNTPSATLSFAHPFGTMNMNPYPSPAPSRTSSSTTATPPTSSGTPTTCPSATPVSMSVPRD